MPDPLDIPTPGAGNAGNPTGATPQGPIEMDPTLAQLLNTSTLQLQTIFTADHQLAVRRASDTALHGLKVIEGVVAKELLVSDDMGDVLRANQASGAPTTRVHDTSVPGASAVKA